MNSVESNKQSVKISVVIPVYNAYPYICRCIESLKSQTLKELEFIFVDDCSEDESVSVIEKWAAVDFRVRILRNEVNQGEGGSRNRGMKEARGLYINTIDPDDWVAPNYYELLYSKALETSAEIVKGTRIKVSEETGKEIEPRSNLNNTISSSLKKGEPLYLRCHYEHQTILFKRSLLDEETKYGKSGNAADTTFLLTLCSKSVTFAVEDRAHYYYLQRKTSATGENSIKRCRNELISFEEQVDYILEKNIVDRYSYRYLADRYNSFTSRFIHAYEEGIITPREKELYISDLKALLLKLTDYERMYEFEPRVSAIIRQGIIPRKGLDKDITIVKWQAKDWITYITALDGESKEAAKEGFKSMLTYHLADRKKEASLRVICGDILKMAAGLKGANQKRLFYGNIKDVFLKDFPAHLKTLIKLLFRTGK